MSSDAESAETPANKHGSITQVKNGFVFYAGGATFVAYTFDELVAHLGEYFK